MWRSRNEAEENERDREGVLRTPARKGTSQRRVEWVRDGGGGGGINARTGPRTQTPYSQPAYFVIRQV